MSLISKSTPEDFLPYVPSSTLQAAVADAQACTPPATLWANEEEWVELNDTKVGSVQGSMIPTLTFGGPYMVRMAPTHGRRFMTNTSLLPCSRSLSIHAELVFIHYLFSPPFQLLFLVSSYLHRPNIRIKMVLSLLVKSCVLTMPTSSSMNVSLAQQVHPLPVLPASLRHNNEQRRR